MSEEKTWGYVQPVPWSAIDDADAMSEYVELAFEAWRRSALDNGLSPLVNDPTRAVTVHRPMLDPETGEPIAFECEDPETGERVALPPMGAVRVEGRVR